METVIPPFDVFQTDADGSVLWRGSATTLEDAHARIQELAAIVPGDYIILSRQSGKKIVVSGGQQSGLPGNCDL